jgi:hypothetical protein
MERATNRFTSIRRQIKPAPLNIDTVTRSILIA